MFWRPDDRMPELADGGNWDELVWGKWPNNQYRWLWRASDAWLPPLDFDAFGKNESLTKMFSGTPYGPVDVISPFSRLEQYKAIAFLGWNTMDSVIFENLRNYVNNGGTLFICGCHFDTRVDLETGCSTTFKLNIHNLMVNNIVIALENTSAKPIGF